MSQHVHITCFVLKDDFTGCSHSNKTLLTKVLCPSRLEPRTIECNAETKCAKDVFIYHLKLYHWHTQTACWTNLDTFYQHIFFYFQLNSQFSKRLSNSIEVYIPCRIILVPGKTNFRSEGNIAIIFVPARVILVPVIIFFPGTCSSMIWFDLNKQSTFNLVL